MSRTDYHILNDPTLAFLEAHQRFTSQRGAGVGMGASLEITKTEAASAPLLTPAELASATSAAKSAVLAAKEEELEETDLKMEEGKAEMVKMEIKEGDAIDIPCAKIETSEEQKEHEGDVGKDKDETAESPRKEIKKEEEVKAEAVKEEEEAQKEEQSGEEDKQTNDHDNDLTEETSSRNPDDALGDQQETELQASPPKAQAALKTAEEEEGDDRENPESPKSADTEKSPEDEEEERLDEDDKSEKSSQAEGMKHEHC